MVLKERQRPASVLCRPVSLSGHPQPHSRHAGPVSIVVGRVKGGVHDDCLWLCEGRLALPALPAMWAAWRHPPRRVWTTGPPVVGDAEAVC